jgi:hypothetical protein
MATAKTKTRSKAAPKPPSRKIEDREQYQRFRDFAREHEADNDPAAFDRAAQQILSPKQSPAKG